MPNRVELTHKSKELLNKLAKSGDLDLRPSFKVIGIGYRKEVKAIFNKKQPRLTSLRWPDLDPIYAERKEKKFPGQPILVATGALRESMTEQGANGNITLIGNKEAVFGSTVFYGKFHDDVDSDRSKIPLRNFSEPSKRRETFWIKQIEKDIRTQIEIKGIDVKGSSF